MDSWHPELALLAFCPPSNQPVHLEVGGVAGTPPSLHPDCSMQRSCALGTPTQPGFTAAPGSRPRRNPTPVTPQEGWPGLGRVDAGRDAQNKKTWVLIGRLATEEMGGGRQVCREQKR